MSRTVRSLVALARTLRRPTGRPALGLAALGLVGLAGSARAQDPIVFDIDTPASQWTWSGTSSLGPIVGNPGQQFALTGTFHALITGGALPITTAQLVAGGSAAVVPDIAGMIPNILPGLPPLATIDITGLTLEFTSPPFPVASNGAFSALVTTTALSGTVTVTPLTGAPTVTDLSGTSGTPQTLMGTLVQNGTVLSGIVATAGAFQFQDPGSGVTANINLVGNLAGDHTCAGWSTYCSANPNSTGVAGDLAVQGSTRIQDQNLVLAASNLPPGEFAYFIVGRTQAVVPNPGGSQGILCLSGNIGRYNLQVGPISQGGTYLISPDLGSIPVNPPMAVQPGETWSFQCWHRDQNPTNTSNFSLPVQVTFCP